MSKFMRRLSAAALVAALLVAAHPLSAGGLFAGSAGGAPGGPTEILSDRLVNDPAERLARFSGAVKAVQGDFSISADELRIYYEGDLLTPEAGSNAGRILRIEAEGRVHIESPRYIAEADRMEYTPATDVIVLSGETARVTSGQSFISGSKITLDRRDGKAVAEGGPAVRVKARLHPEDRETMKVEGD